MDPKIGALIDEREIEKVLLRYCRGIDRLDIELLRSAFHSDAIFEISMFSGSAQDFCNGLEEFTRAGKYGLTQHRLSNVLIELDGDHAKSESYCVAHHADVPFEGGLIDLRVGVRYADRLERRGGQWKIANRKVIYDWNQTAPSSAQWQPPFFSHELILGRRGREDASYFGA
jgi:hypothetical protein